MSEETSKWCPPGIEMSWLVGKEILRITPRLFPIGGEMRAGILAPEDMKVPEGYSLAPTEGTEMHWEDAGGTLLWKAGASVGVLVKGKNPCTLFRVDHVAAPGMWITFLHPTREQGGREVLP